MATPTLQEANDLLKTRHPTKEELKEFPFGKYLQKLFENDDDYQTHGPKVLAAMNTLLSFKPEEIIKGRATPEQERTLRNVVFDILNKDFRDWERDNVDVFFRIAALYHDIGKYIIKDRHPNVGWQIIQYIDPKEKEKLRGLLPNDEQFFQMLLIVIRDHDQFGVISTGEASYPILLRAIHSMNEAPETRIKILSALMVFNLADMAGIIDVDGEITDMLIADRQFMINAINDCAEKAVRLDDYIVEKSVDKTTNRIQRLLAEASRKYDRRRRELNDPQFIQDELRSVFGSDANIREFSKHFTRICKLDYSKRFFEAVIEYCEGPQQSTEGKILNLCASERLDRNKVFYAFIGTLKRITTSYVALIETESGAWNLIGVELKELTPKQAPEKTARIIELLVNSHYPGLTWMMSDVPAWYF